MGTHVLTVCEIGVSLKDPFTMEALGLRTEAWSPAGLRAQGVERHLLADALLLLHDTQSRAFLLQKGN